MHLSSFFMLIAYKLFTIFLAPLAACFIAYKKRRDPPYGLRILELLGFYREKMDRCIWFHGASVGEVNSLKPFILEYQKIHPTDKLVITTMTTTGANAAKSLNNVLVKFAPLDSPLAVGSFFRHFHPETLIIIDTELWPNMFDAAKRHKCPVMIINGRMQEKNCNKYLKHKKIVKDLISSRISKVMAISHSDKCRFERIGVPEEKVIVTGNIKYDLKPREALFEQARKSKEQLSTACVFGAISIHEGEEKIIINAYRKAKQKLPDLKLVIVPRHQSTVEKTCDYLNSLHIEYEEKSTLRSLTDIKKDILIGDTMGEIELYFGLCDIVFMGGSFVNVGGHNPLEPAYFSLPIITGPDYHNFQEQFGKLIDAGGCFVAENDDALSEYLVKLLNDRILLEKTGVMALDVQQQGRGALLQTLEQVDLMLYKDA